MPQVVRGLVAVIVLVLMGTVAAWAAPITGTSKKLASGTAVVGTCGVLSGATVTLNGRSSTLLGLTVRNLPSTCNAARLWATASNAAGADLAHGGPITVASGAATVTMSANPTTASVTTITVALVGP